MRRRFLVAVEDAPEVRAALYYASLLARRAKAQVALLGVVEEPEQSPWRSVAHVMQQEAHERTRALLAGRASQVRAWSGREAVVYARDESGVDAVRAVLAEQEDIVLLVLGDTTEGLTGALVREMRTFSVPVVLVPASLSTEELRTLA